MKVVVRPLCNDCTPRVLGLLVNIDFIKNKVYYVRTGPLFIVRLNKPLDILHQDNCGNKYNTDIVIGKLFKYSGKKLTWATSRYGTGAYDFNSSRYEHLRSIERFKYITQSLVGG